LLALPGLDLSEITTLFTHYQPELQCGKFIQRRLPDVQIVRTASTAEAAQKAAEAVGAACISSRRVAEEMQLAILAEGIQDTTNNVTRFAGIAPRHSDYTAPEKHKTMVAMVVPDRSGALLRPLAMLADERINLTAMKTLPIRDNRVFSGVFKDWFVLDLSVATTHDGFRRFLTAIENSEDVVLAFKILGSYGVVGPNGHGGRAKLPDDPVRPDAADSIPQAEDLVGEVNRLIAAGESSSVEYKSSLRVDRATGQVNKALSKTAVKSVAAFMNSYAGGSLLLGVADDGIIDGIDADIATISRKNIDGFLQTLFNLISDSIGAEYCQFVQPQIVGIADKTVCLVRVSPSRSAAWVKADSGRDTFYVRSGNTSNEIPGRNAQKYINERFGPRR
jgi:hypothetical protein